MSTYFTNDRSKFERLFHAFDYETTQKEILERRLIDCDFFTVLWRIFLHCLPRDPNQWHEMLSITRNQYTELRQKFDILPSKISQDKDRFEIENHPLSQDKNVRLMIELVIHHEVYPRFRATGQDITKIMILKGL